MSNVGREGKDLSEPITQQDLLRLCELADSDCQQFFGRIKYAVYQNRILWVSPFVKGQRSIMWMETKGIHDFDVFTFFRKHRLDWPTDAEWPMVSDCQSLGCQ